jgi:FkbM family methyltransferase
MRDYSQHGDSKWIYNHIKNKKIQKLFVEIGALDGITNSNARMFLDLGWNGIFFEPNPISFNKLFNNIKKYKNVQCYNLAIGHRTKVVNFNIIERPNYHGHSRINKGGNHTVLMITPETIIPNHVGIMTIDAEGYDTAIINHIINKTNIRPEILMIENEKKNGDIRKSQIDILQHEYTLLKQINVNSIWEKK